MSEPEHLRCSCPHCPGRVITPTSRVTPREMQILKSVADGKADKEIAVELGVSQKTVKNLNSRLFTRLNVRNRTEAAIWAARNGIV